MKIDYSSLNPREGEIVENEMVGRDAEGKAMSWIQVAWFGMDNVTANMAQRQIVEALNALAEQWSAVKNGQVEVTQKPGVKR